jgi:hyperosmotically inducible periplasmic protein
MRISNYLATGMLTVVLGVAAGCSEKRTNAAAMTDDQLENAISARINADTQLGAYKINVDADADENKVTLTGDVPTEALRTRAVGLAKEINGQLTVTDKIDVKPGEVTRADYNEEMARQERERATSSGEKVGDDLEDAWLHTKVRTKLLGTAEFPGGGINVDVVNKVVILRGTVESVAAKAEAERIAKETDGVSQVKNQLIVKKG